MASQKEQNLQCIPHGRHAHVLIGEIMQHPAVAESVPHRQVGGNAPKLHTGTPIPAAPRRVGARTLLLGFPCTPAPGPCRPYSPHWRRDLPKPCNKSVRNGLEVRPVTSLSCRCINIKLHACTPLTAAPSRLCVRASLLGPPCRPAPGP